MMEFPYRSLNTNQLSKLFDNRHISLEILEKLGFEWENNRLTLKYESINLNNITNNIKFCQLKYNICLKLQNTVINFVKRYSYESNSSCTKNKNSNDNLDGLVAQMIDALPASVLKENADLIDKWIEKNDFRALKEFYKKRNVILCCRRWSHQKFQDAASLICIKRLQVISDSLDALLANHGDGSMVDWLYALSLPTLIVNNLIEMIIERNFDLTNKDDRFWFAKIVTDRVVAIMFYEWFQNHKHKPLLSKVIGKYVDHVNSVTAKRQLTDDLFVLFNRYESEFKERNKLFEQEAEKCVYVAAKVSIHCGQQDIINQIHSALARRHLE